MLDIVLTTVDIKENDNSKSTMIVTVTVCRKSTIHHELS